MKSNRFLKISIMTLGICAAVAASILAGLICFKAINVFAKDDLPEASFCSFVIPPEFVPGEEKGLFININHPMESSSIKYSYYDNGLDTPLTNREKKEQAESGEVQAKVADESQNLTKEIYQNTVSAAYNSAYGENVGYKVISFDKITVDGYPAYRIEGSYKAAQEETVHQTVIMVLSKYRTFTITFQRAEDDECQEFFAESESSIHVH